MSLCVLSICVCVTVGMAKGVCVYVCVCVCSHISRNVNLCGGVSISSGCTCILCVYKYECDVCMSLNSHASEGMCLCV